jgi:hypothetical protein
MWPERHPALRGSRILDHLIVGGPLFRCARPRRFHALLTAKRQPVPVVSVRLAARWPELGRSSAPGRGHGSSEIDPKMLRFLCRLVGFLALAAAAAGLAYDGVTSVFAESLHVSSVAEVWEHIPDSWLAALQPIVAWLSQRWREMIQPYLLQQPVWLVLGVAGATLLWAKEESTDRTRERLKHSVR